VLAVGMLICILTGGNIDLSVGSVVALVGALAGTLIVNRVMNIWVAMAICLAVGIAIGIWQGFWIAYIRIPAFIVTLAGMLLWRGVALIILGGLTISPFPNNYLNLFNSYVPDVFGGSINILSLVIGFVVSVVYIIVQAMGRINKSKKGYQLESITSLLIRTVIIVAVIMALSLSLSNHKGIPTILILLAVVVMIYAYYTTKTVPGRYLYAMGGNEKAAKLSGINTNKVLFFAYVNMAFLSAVAALMCVARFNSAAPTAGTNYEMDAIGACYIGGASAYGGIGTVAGVVIGAIFMGVLNNGMSIMGIDANIQKTVKGIVLLAAVAFDVISKKRSKTA
jgi:putative multiple sugar transport system permease protein